MAELATDTSEHTVSRDESRVVYRTGTGAIATIPGDGSGAAEKLVADGAQQLGAVSIDGRHVLFATKVVDGGAGQIAPSTDVWIASVDAPGAPRSLVTTATSCPGCLGDSFTPDGALTLALDPIDNAEAAQGVGPVRVFDAKGGTSLTTFGTHVFVTVATGRGTGADAGFVVVSALPDETRPSALAYDIDTRTLRPDDEETLVARGADMVAIDSARTLVVFSLPGSADPGGIWVAPLP